MLRTLAIVFAVVVVVIVLIGGGLLIYVKRGVLFRPDFAKVGGTELVFEIDKSSVKDGFKIEDLCEALQRRLDPNGAAGVRVQPEGEWSVLVRAPRSKLYLTAEHVIDMVTPQGKLEFLIVASPNDDGPALEAAKDLFEKSKDELARREKNAEPPPPPTRDGKTTFEVALDGKPWHSYRWAEVGKSYLWTLRLNSDALDQPDNADQRKQIEDGVSSGVPFLFRSGFDQSCLLYVRKITDWDKRQKRDRELGKTREYFILLRDEDERRAVTGDFLTRAESIKDDRDRLAIDFTFNKDGGDRFYDLTSRNRPSGGEAGFKRHLAIVFDGQVMSAPSLLSPIRDRGRITGEFTTQEVDDTIRILRAGALPARLKPVPVSQLEIAPK